MLFKKIKRKRYYRLAFIMVIPLSICTLGITAFSIWGLVVGTSRNNQKNEIEKSNGIFDNSYKYIKNTTNHSNYFYKFYEDCLKEYFPDSINLSDFNKTIRTFKKDKNKKEVFLSYIENIKYQDEPNDSLYQEYSYPISKTIDKLKEIDFTVYAESNILIVASITLGISILLIAYILFIILERRNVRLVKNVNE